MPFFDLSQQASREVFPGVVLTPVWGEQLMLSFVHFTRADALVPTHSHPHEQMGMGIEGEFELTIADEARVICPGDSDLIPSNVPHSARSLGGPCRVLDVFSPVREDYKF